jgi:hypothetical protein
MKGRGGEGRGWDGRKGEEKDKHSVVYPTHAA